MTRGRTLAAVRGRLRRVRLLAFDVDGVLTDGGILVHPDGGESKWFHVRDGLGIVAVLNLARADVACGAITLRVRDGAVEADHDVRFHVAVPARHWWDDVGLT